MTSNTADDKPGPGLDRKTETGQLNTFIGVFTPTILRILGVIMYLRFGWVAGLSLSGDLKDPRQSIPRGTIAAALTGRG